MPDNENGRVTMAVLATKLDHISITLDRLQKRLDDDHEELESIQTTILILKWSGGVVTTIVVALAISAIRRALGI